MGKLRTRDKTRDVVEETEPRVEKPENGSQERKEGTEENRGDQGKKGCGFADAEAAVSRSEVPQTGFSILHTNFSAEIYFVNMSKNWTEAQSYCREKYTDLVTIDNPEEMNRVINSVNLTGYTGPAWIGLEKGNSWNWQWSLEERLLYRSAEGDQRYILINDAKTWKDAQTYCRENYTDLVSVRNQTENDLIHNMTKSGTCVWIGLYRDYWQWSDQRNSSFRYWKLGKPDSYDEIENCTIASITQTLSGTWDDRECGEKHPFLCYYDVPLILVQENKTWNEALNYCRENYVDLVSVHSKEIQSWVEKKVRSATSDHVWLGLRFSCFLNFWFWVSGHTVCYDNWAPGNGTGTGHCGNTGAVRSGGGHQWVSLPDTEELNFICVTC
ncbi:macrophage mannose receptor 1-like [Scleropages formosus]|uniref:macrophage mannose receptor 1-like n=1 Tax=Scleropages formosus TaxID=113540 RepID=UPI0010FA6C95|nr:macrophage mannose receptor 1-like [Scleropages formosus]